MNNENKGMQLRQRRVLADISNKAAVAPAAVEILPKKQKRRRTTDRDDEDFSFITKKPSVAKKVEIKTVTVSAAATSRNSSKEIGTPDDLEYLENIVPTHVINRSIPLHIQGSEPRQCLDIIDGMYNNYYEIEDECSAKPYMSRQKDINQKMRMILVDWIIEIHVKYKLHAQTLWLTVNILDRYLERIEVMRARLQLVGVSALLIASKHEEIYPPTVEDCVFVTDDAYTKHEILAMETLILNLLDYKISVPTGYHFFIRYLNCIKASENTRHLASYYAERNLQESDMLNVLPHIFSAAAVYAALHQQSGTIPGLRTASVWTTALQEETGCTVKDLEECARTIIKHVGEDPLTASRRQLVAAKRKYSKVSGLQLPYI